MYRKPIILLFAAVLSGCWTLCPTAAAQEARVVGIPQELHQLPAQLPKGETIDTAVMTIYYRHAYPVDDFKEGFREVEDCLALQVGRRYTHTFSWNLYLLDRNQTFGEKHAVPFQLTYIGWEVLRDRQTGRIEVLHRIHNSGSFGFGPLECVVYGEEEPRIAWVVDEEPADTLAGYACRRAEGDWGGRRWRVWFAEELPAPVGPWKLGGLPGVILRAECAEGSYRFEVERIEAEAVPIVRYDRRVQRMSKQKWQQTERRMFTHPRDYFTRNGELKVFTLEGRPLTGEWTIRYDPMEKE